MGPSETARPVAARLLALPVAAHKLDSEAALIALSLVRSAAIFEIESLAYVRDWLNLSASASDFSEAGSWGAARVALEFDDEDRETKEFATRVCQWLLTRARRTEDGLLYPFADSEIVTADSLFFSAPLLSQAGNKFADDRLLDEAARQLFLYAGHAHDPVTHLFFVSWDPVQQMSDETLDAGSNGFVINALVDTLLYLPNEHPRRRALHMVLTYMAEAVETHQNPVGLWHALMDDETSATHPAATGLFVTALSRGVVNRFLDAHYRDVAARGWQALQSKVKLADESEETLAAILLASSAMALLS